MKLYQVLIFNKIPKMFFYEAKSSNELLVADGYVCVYKQNKLYYYQKVESSENLSQFKSFIEINLNLENLNVVKSDLVEFNKKLNYQFLKPIKSNIFKFFIFYMIVLCFGLYFLEFDETQSRDDLNIIQNNTLVLKKNMEFEPISDDIVFLYKKAKDNDILISSLSFKESKFFLSIKSNNKKDIYEFLKELNANVVNMIYDEKLKEYLVNASFKIYRR